MKSDNIFRFVSIRPPGDDEIIERVPGDEGVIEEVGRRLTHNLGRRGTTRSEAATETGREIINSQDYVLARDWGHDVLANAYNVHRLLRQAQQERDWKAFQEEARKILAPPPSSKMTAEAFIKTDAFADVERTLWRSYFATVLNPYERPKDAESLSAWLVFLHLLKSTSTQEFSTRAERVQRTRPAVPASFFFDGPAPPSTSEPAPTPPSAPDTRGDTAKVVREEITRLGNARKELNDLFAERVRTTAYAVRASPMKAADRRGPDSERTSPTAGSHGSATYESTQAAAWKLTPDDFRQRERLVETIRAVGVVPELAAIPDAINRLDTRIAELNAEIARIDSTHDVALVGKAFVRLRRPATVSIREVGK